MHCRGALYLWTDWFVEYKMSSRYSGFEPHTSIASVNSFPWCVGWNSHPFGYLKSNRNGPYIMQCGVCSFVAKTLEFTLALKFFGSLTNDLQVYQVVFSIT